MSALRAPVYVLAVALMVGAIMLDEVPPGVGWGMFLIGCALVAAAGSASGTGPTGGTKRRARSAHARR